MTAGRPIRVLIVDDSALVRQMLTQMLSSAPDIEVIGTAADPLIARKKIVELNPDVLTLDVEMPHMDGITFLEKIMRLRPMPVVMISTLTQEGAETSIRALELGAVDFVGKPTAGLAESFGEKRDEIIAKVRNAAAARTRATSAPQRAGRPGGDAAEGAEPDRRQVDLIAIGASTGGVTAIAGILAALTLETPPVVIVQHIQPGFTTALADRLDRNSAIKVSEAAEGMELKPGMAAIAPSGSHLEVARVARKLICRLSDAAAVGGHRPSVDQLFHSVAEIVGARAIGVILTGMGRDGADGLAAMREAGALTIGQDQATCVVYGMPRVARSIGAVTYEMPLADIPDMLLRQTGGAA